MRRWTQTVVVRRIATRFVDRHRAPYPVVLKPDVGERGSGVAVIRTDEELRRYLAANPRDTIIQRYVPGLEFGIFYYRYPNERCGRISSITEKRFPEVIGDGRSTLRDLILCDPRAVCMAAAYEKALRRSMDEIQSAGERVQLAELGSHCRGAIFLDGARLKTPALEAASRRIPGDRAERSRRRGNAYL